MKSLNRRKSINVAPTFSNVPLADDDAVLATELAPLFVFSQPAAAAWLVFSQPADAIPAVLSVSLPSDSDVEETALLQPLEIDVAGPDD